MQKPVTVVLADDHKIFRDGFKLVLQSIGGLELTGEADNGEEFLELFHKLKPDLVFLDIKMPKLSGLDVVKKIQPTAKHTKIIVLTAIEDSESISEVIENGADGFLLKSADYQTIEQAVQTVLAGKSFFSEEILDSYLKLRKADTQHQQLPTLTKREKDVLKLVCSGASAPEISDQLRVSKRTVEKHKENLMTKTHTRSTSELIVFAFKKRLVLI